MSENIEKARLIAHAFNLRQSLDAKSIVNSQLEQVKAELGRQIAGHDVVIAMSVLEVKEQIGKLKALDVSDDVIKGIIGEATWDLVMKEGNDEAVLASMVSFAQAQR